MNHVTVSLRHTESDADIARCFPVMHVLRPDLASAADFTAYVHRQAPLGYRLLAAWRDEAPVALAGYRRQENLVHGPHLFVDDLVVLEGERRQNHGARLLDAIFNEAKQLGYRKVVLGAALDNFLGHRFYFRQSMLATGFSFSRVVD